MRSGISVIKENPFNDFSNNRYYVLRQSLSLHVERWENSGLAPSSHVHIFIIFFKNLKCYFIFLCYLFLYQVFIFLLFIFIFTCPTKMYIYLFFFLLKILKYHFIFLSFLFFSFLFFRFI